MDEAERQQAAVVPRRLQKTRLYMVLTKEELISSLQNEVRILLHLASKVDRNQLDYRPTPKQRSTIELLRYLTIMGPNLIPAIQDRGFRWRGIWRLPGRGQRHELRSGPRRDRKAEQ